MLHPSKSMSNRDLNLSISKRKHLLVIGGVEAITLPLRASDSNFPIDIMLTSPHANTHSPLNWHVMFPRRMSSKPSFPLFLMTRH